MRQAITDQGSYEAYTCLKQNSTFANPEVDRDSSGQLVYSWKTNTPPVTEDEQVALQQAGVLHPGEGLINLTDSVTGLSVPLQGWCSQLTLCVCVCVAALSHSRSHNPQVKLTRSALEWNEYLKQWVLIGQAINTNQPGYSLLGEIYFAAADKVEGPYRKATKVVTHKVWFGGPELVLLLLVPSRPAFCPAGVHLLQPHPVSVCTRGRWALHLLCRNLHSSLHEWSHPDATIQLQQRRVSPGCDQGGLNFKYTTFAKIQF